MAKLGDHIENALNEARMLLLGGQVLIGFSYRICFEQGFQQIPLAAQVAEVAGIGIMTGALGALIWPAAFHQIAQQGRENPTIYSLATRTLDWMLLPLGISLGLIFYPACAALQIAHPAWIGAATGIFALLMWYTWAFTRPHSKKREDVIADLQRGQHDGDDSDISERIKQLLIECRMALPGAQAFLGFQFAIVFTDSFKKLPRSSHWIHFGSLLATTISIVLLIAVAAYHRLAEGGEETENFHRVASRFLLAALVFLAPGMTGDLLVVIRALTGSLSLSVWISVLLLLAFYGLWFGISLWRAKSRRIG
ncbi:MAG TPA: DUF6328 family protein [Candidatus Angelobacter sp.]